MPGKELRDDLSKEEIEEKRERTIKTHSCSSQGGRRNKVSYQKEERSRGQQSKGQEE